MRKSTKKQVLELIRQGLGGEMPLPRWFTYLDLAVQDVRSREAFQQMLQEGRLTPVARDFPRWKMVFLGRRTSALHYIQMFEGGGCGDYAREILEHMPITKSETRVDLVRLTMREMTFWSGATTAEIRAWVETHGLEFCPAEVGPALRDQYRDQPYGEWILIGMEPVRGSGNSPKETVYQVGHGDSGRLLNTNGPDTAGKWSPDNIWVFARPRPTITQAGIGNSLGGTENSVGMFA